MNAEYFWHVFYIIGWLLLILRWLKDEREFKDHQDSAKK
jgi:hypothetical protein